MKKLAISDGLSLPLDVITMATAILGIRGSGKTNTAGVWAEELLKHGQQVVVIDPLNGWWGLKSSADGQRPGYPVVVFGGNHADVPLAGTEGKALADFVVERRVPCVFSLRHLNVSAQRRFVTDFAVQLFFRKGEEAHQDPVLVVIDEAHKFIPQKTFSDMTHMVHAIEALVREGRSSGIGVTLIDQRAASVNKDVLTQVELMVVHRTTAPQDKKALDEWIKDNAGEERRAEFMQSLARLKLGEAWFWSVGWLDTFSRVQVRMRETFDSSATPKPGERRVTPSTLADVNLDELREQLAATIEQAKANDPGELKRRVTQLERELARATKESPPAEPQIIRVPVITDGQMENLRTLFEDVKTYTDRLEACKWAFEKGMGKFIEDLDSYRRAAEARPASAHTSKPPPHTSGVKAQGAAPAGAGPRGDGAVTGPQQRMLDALRSFEVIGMDAVQKAHVAVFSGQSSKSSGFRANVSQLSSGGYVERLGDGLLRLTDAGRSQASDAYDQPLSLSALHAAWLEKLTTPQRTMLRLVIERHPEAIPKLDLAHRSGQSPLSSGYRANLSTLSSLGLVRRLPGGEVAATALLFPEGLR